MGGHALAGEEVFRIVVQAELLRAAGIDGGEDLDLVEVIRVNGPVTIIIGLSQAAELEAEVVVVVEGREDAEIPSGLGDFFPGLGGVEACGEEQEGKGGEESFHRVSVFVSGSKDGPPRTQNQI